jgi:hypothetical protein
MEPVALKPGTVVKAEAAAALLVNTRALHFLAPFMIEANTLSMVAKQLGTAPSAVAYWVPQFLGAGLIRRVPPPRTQPSTRGKWYRSVSKSFLVPTSLLPADHNGSSIENGRRHYIDAFYAALATAASGDTRWVSVSVTGSNAQIRGSMLDPSMPDRRRGRTLDAWVECELTKTEARQLKEEMLALLANYRARERAPRRSTYIVHLGVAPSEDA